MKTLIERLKEVIAEGIRSQEPPEDGKLHIKTQIFIANCVEGWFDDLIYDIEGKYAEWAEQIMRNILYDNGAVNAVNPEFLEADWRFKIASALFYFNFLNEDIPGFPDINEIINDFSFMEDGLLIDTYQSSAGFDQLNEVLNAYVDTI